LAAPTAFCSEVEFDGGAAEVLPLLEPELVAGADGAGGAGAVTVFVGPGTVTVLVWPGTFTVVVWPGVVTV
jgi:hypothetical protein